MRLNASLPGLSRRDQACKNSSQHGCLTAVRPVDVMLSLHGSGPAHYGSPRIQPVHRASSSSIAQFRATTSWARPLLKQKLAVLPYRDNTLNILGIVWFDYCVPFIVLFAGTAQVTVAPVL